MGGATKRHEILELERKCQKIDFNLEVTGQFGIGVMSYFMIADKMIIKTKKSVQSGIHEANGWEFEINGLSGFGELRKSDCDSNGTTLKLKVKNEFFKYIEDDKIIIQLIEDTLNKIPCNFRFTSLNKKEISYLPGWCKNQTFFRKELAKQLDFVCRQEIETSNEFLSE